VTDIMAEISSASAEQSAGIEQVNAAIGRMDEATRQNATLVGQASAAAASLQDEAATLADVVSVFKMQSETSGVVASKPQRKALALSA
jgi:methyl-accepting chemotaxis protein